MRTYGVGSALILAVFLAACGGAESRWAGTMSDSAGVTIVSNTDVGIWATGEEWTFEEELRIGSVEGDTEYQFGEVGRMAVDSKGRIFVLDGQAQHIRVYLPDGTYEQTVGARGGGPGELRAGLAVLVGPGDSLLVPDGQNLRVNRYAPDGSSAGSFRMVLEEGRPMAWKASTTGIVAEQIRPLSMLLPGEAVENPEDVILHVAIDGTVIDTLLEFPSGRSLGPQGMTLYATEPAWDLSDDGQLVFGAADEYRISVYADGQLRRIITRPFERRPVADQDIEAILGEMERRWDEAGISPEVRERIWSRIHFSDFYPAFQAVAIGPQGTIWVGRVKPASELNAKELEYYHEWPVHEWDVFDAEGRLLGTVTMPERFNPMAFRGDKVYGAWRDELDVGYVVVLRIVGVGATGT
ncbi:MAG TPA: hypothetical protein VLC48_10265 [Gemmatimonadota bacterium]|nr:hypothetical protein [Gemmatimonadota bacterium]